MTRAVREGSSSSVAGSADTYFTAYALFLKATETQIAFLATVPALFGSFTQLFSGWLSHKTGKRKPIIVTGVVLQALMWLPMIWLPYFFPAHAATILVASIVLYSAAANIASPVWNSMMGDLVPEDGRGRYFSRRSRYANLASFIALAAAGWILHLWEAQNQTRVGFLMIFTAAMVARLYSVYQIARMVDPPQPPAPEPPTLRHMLDTLPGSNFLRFSLFMSAMNFSANIAGPFFTVYMLRDLGFSYLEFTVSTSSVVLMQFLTLSQWGRLTDRFGNRVVLAITGAIIPVLPLLWLFTTSFWVILAIQLLGGLAWAGFHLSAGNFVYDTVPPYKRSVYGAMHNVLNAMTSFMGGALGAYLSTRLPANAVVFGVHFELLSSLGWIFLISALARACTAISFIPMLREERIVHQVSAGYLVARLTGLHILRGYIARRRLP